MTYRRCNECSSSNLYEGICKLNVLMVFDQVQAGMGGKENPNLPLGGKKGPIGSVTMLEPYLAELDENVIACFYCGDGYFKNHQDEVTNKMIGMIKKFNPDVVICGPAYNYKGYAYMCAIVADAVQTQTDIPAIAAMSAENEETISAYKEKICIVKMPKKGGTGLSNALRNICLFAKKMANHEDLSEIKKIYCF